MSPQSFSTYQQFIDEKQATEFVSLLEANLIAYQVEDASLNIIPGFSNQPFNKQVDVKIKKEDFEKADNLLHQLFAEQIKTLDKGYYLFEFTDTELSDLLKKSDEWSKFDCFLAQLILKERGHEVDSKQLSEIQNNRLQELSQPQNSQRFWIVLGYLSAIAGGFFGILLGWHLLNHKKTLPNGESVNGFSTSDRMHGSRILFIGTCMIIVVVVWRMMNMYQ